MGLFLLFKYIYCEHSKSILGVLGFSCDPHAPFRKSLISTEMSQYLVETSCPDDSEKYRPIDNILLKSIDFNSPQKWADLLEFSEQDLLIEY